MGRNAKGEGSVVKTADGRYRAYITINGKRKYLPFTATKKESAENLRKLVTQSEEGVVVAGEVPTVTKWMRHWVKTANLSPGTRANYDHNIEKYVVPNIGHYKLSKLTAEHLEQLYADMAAGKLSRPRTVKTVVDGVTVESKMQMPLSAQTIGNVHANIRRALNVAMKRGKVTRNVALFVELPEKPKAQTTTFSRQDRDAILAAASQDRYAARWIIGMLFGPRPSEILGLTWSCVDWQRKTITIKDQLQRIRGGGLQMIGATKTEAGHRVITVPDVVLDLLREQQQQQMIDRIEAGDDYLEWEFDGEPVPLVFRQKNGRPIDIGVDTRNWKRVLDAAGVPYARRYQGRHTAATLMLDMGTPIEVVSNILGHRRTSFTLDTYVHPLEEAKQSLADLLGGIAAPFAAPYRAETSRNQQAK